MCRFVSVSRYFDRERRSSYTFEVRATDGGRYDTRSEKAQIHISVTDVNDNKPIFTKYPFTADVPAFTQPNQQLLQIMAEDRDEGANGEIIYSLINEPSNSKFRIHPTTGVVTASSSLTMESGRLFHLEVLARDKGSPSLSSTGLIEIRVADAPGTDVGTPAAVTLRFQNSTYNVQLPENAPVGKDVIQVRKGFRSVSSPRKSADVVVLFSGVGRAIRRPPSTRHVQLRQWQRGQHLRNQFQQRPDPSS